MGLLSQSSEAGGRRAESRYSHNKQVKFMVSAVRELDRGPLGESGSRGDHLTGWPGKCLQIQAEEGKARSLALVRFTEV